MQVLAFLFFKSDATYTYIISVNSTGETINKHSNREGMKKNVQLTTKRTIY